MKTPNLVQFTRQHHPEPLSNAQRQAILSNPGFGKFHTDHMVTADWTAAQGWHDHRVQPYGPLMLEPSSLVLHYAQAIFEGLKAYRHQDGSLWAFRPQANAARFNRSAERLGLPELPQEVFLESLKQLVQTDASWVPSEPETSLYLRPVMMANENFLGVRGAEKVMFFVIGSPAGAYFSNGFAPVPIWVSADRTRAAQGGTGYAKCAGNYAGSLAPLQEARQNGCAQVLFLDAQEGRYLEELGGMNIFIVFKDGTLATPALSDSILAGVTRASIIEIAKLLGHPVQERKISLQEVGDGLATGEITEVFACGTAAVIFPIALLKGRDFSHGRSDASAGPVTLQLRQQLTDIQFGHTPSPHPWMFRLD